MPFALLNDFSDHDDDDEKTPSYVGDNHSDVEDNGNMSDDSTSHFNVDEKCDDGKVKRKRSVSELVADEKQSYKKTKKKMTETPTPSPVQKEKGGLYKLLKPQDEKDDQQERVEEETVLLDSQNVTETLRTIGLTKKNKRSHTTPIRPADKTVDSVDDKPKTNLHKKQKREKTKKRTKMPSAKQDDEISDDQYEKDDEEAIHEDGEDDESDKDEENAIEDDNGVASSTESHVKASQKEKDLTKKESRNNTSRPKKNDFTYYIPVNGEWVKYDKKENIILGQILMPETGHVRDMKKELVDFENDISDGIEMTIMIYTDVEGVRYIAYKSRDNGTMDIFLRLVTPEFEISAWEYMMEEVDLPRKNMTKFNDTFYLPPNEIKKRKGWGTAVINFLSKERIIGHESMPILSSAVKRHLEEKKIKEKKQKKAKRGGRKHPDTKQQNDAETRPVKLSDKINISHTIRLIGEAEPVPENAPTKDQDMHEQQSNVPNLSDKINKPEMIVISRGAEQVPEHGPTNEQIMHGQKSNAAASPAKRKREDDTLDKKNSAKNGSIRKYMKKNSNENPSSRQKQEQHGESDDGKDNGIAVKVNSENPSDVIKTIEDDAAKNGRKRPAPEAPQSHVTVPIDDDKMRHEREEINQLKKRKILNHTKGTGEAHNDADQSRAESKSEHTKHLNGKMAGKEHLENTSLDDIDLGTLLKLVKRKATQNGFTISITLH